MVPERKSKGNFMKDRDIHGEGNEQCTAQRYKKTNELMLGLNENADQLAMANSERWYGHMFREDGHMLRRALDSKIDDQRKKWRLKKLWKK